MKKLLYVYYRDRISNDFDFRAQIFSIGLNIV